MDRLAMALRAYPLLQHLGRAGVRIADMACQRLHVAPLSIRTPVPLAGFFAHRVFLGQVARGEYEPYSLSLFQEAVGPGVVVIDGGAHMGLYSILAHRRGACVYAYEPDPVMAWLCRQNLARNDCRVMLRSVALSEAPGTQAFYRIPATFGNSLVERREYAAEASAIQVTTVALDDEAIPAGRLVIKLDLEGHEPIALKGMRRLLETRPVTMLVEANPAALSNLGYGVLGLVRDLRAFGLSVSFVDEAQRCLVPPEEGRKGNLYAISSPGSSTTVSNSLDAVDARANDTESLGPL